MPPLMFCFTLKSIGALAATPDAVLVPLGHCKLATGWRFDLTASGATSIYPGASILGSRFVVAIAFKKSLLALLSASDPQTCQTWARSE